MKYKIIVEDNAFDLMEKVNVLLEDKWMAVGSHTVVVRKTQNRYSGERLMDCYSQLEYTQTLIRVIDGIPYICYNIAVFNTFQGENDEV